MKILQLDQKLTETKLDDEDSAAVIIWFRITLMKKTNSLGQDLTEDELDDEGFAANL